MLGDKQEAAETKRYHEMGKPFLVSSMLLRSNGLGQVDVAYLQKNKSNSHWLVKIVEVKTKTAPSRQQWQRLLKTQDFLAKVLEMESKLEVKFCQKDQDSLFF